MPSIGGSASSGSSSVVAGMPIDTPPTTPHAKDDEFLGTTLDAKWTTITSASPTQATVANSVVAIEPSATGSAAGNKGAYGIRQVAPTGAFTVTAKIIPALHPDGDVSGLYVGKVGGNWFQIGRSGLHRWQRWQGGMPSETAVWNDYDGGGFDTHGGSDVGWPNYGWHYFQIVYSGGNVSCFQSPQGLKWYAMGGARAAASIDRIGIAMNGGGATVSNDHVVLCDWFRVTEP